MPLLARATFKQTGEMNSVARAALIRRLHSKHLKDQCYLAALKDIAVLIVQSLHHEFASQDDTKEL